MLPSYTEDKINWTMINSCAIFLLFCNSVDSQKVWNFTKDLGWLTKKNKKKTKRQTNNKKARSDIDKRYIYTKIILKYSAFTVGIVDSYYDLPGHDLEKKEYEQTWIRGNGAPHIKRFLVKRRKIRCPLI